MSCPSCGTEVAEGSTFCSRCGTALLAQRCPSCGAEVPAGSDFCPQCGAAIAAPAVSMQGVQAQAVLYRRRYSLWRVGVLGVVSFGLYFLYWLFVTWKHMSAETRGQHHHPGWHWLAVLVPIYGLFVLYDHFATIKGLQNQAGVRSSLAPGLVVVIAIVSYVVVVFGMEFTLYRNNGEVDFSFFYIVSLLTFVIPLLFVGTTLGVRPTSTSTGTR